MKININKILKIITKLNSKFNLVNSGEIEELKEEWTDSDYEKIKSTTNNLDKLVNNDSDMMEILTSALKLKMLIQDFKSINEDVIKVLDIVLISLMGKYFPEEKLLFDGDIDKYLEGNLNAEFGGFFYDLHEKSIFNQELFDEMYNLIKSNFDQIKDKIILYKIYSLMLKYVVHHQSRNDLFGITNLSVDELTENLSKFDDNIISHIV